MGKGEQGKGERAKFGRPFLLEFPCSPFPLFPYFPPLSVY